MAAEGKACELLLPGEKSCLTPLVSEVCSPASPLYLHTYLSLHPPIPSDQEQPSKDEENLILALKASSSSL